MLAAHDLKQLYVTNRLAAPSVRTDFLPGFQGLGRPGNCGGQLSE